MDAHALDFWIGEWDCDWGDGAGRNTITRELGGKVVVEQFEALGSEGFEGTSVSVFDEEAGWRQTWVDSNGGYWHLEGSPLEDGSLTFVTPAPVDAERLYKRMVFSNIAHGGFDWRWEFAPDREDWQERWAIRYTRRPNRLAT